MSSESPYALDPHAVSEPPRTLWGMTPYLGPGFVLSASIVGSGELIATTALGAKVGFVLLWVIVLSCVIKVALQLQFGRHTILTGQTALDAFDDLRGPRAGGVGWSIWLWLSIQPVKILQLGGIVFAVAVLMNLVIPAVSIAVWCWIAAVSAALLVSLNRYKMIERLCLALLAAFTLMTLASVVALQWTDYAITASDLVSGLQGRFPEGETFVFFLFGAFGLTGVGGDEIMQYTYWLLEKGYASHAGPTAPDDPAWRARARGWIRVMYADALLSLLAYTGVTTAFYLLGAAVLHRQGLTPEGSAVITTLAQMYTSSLGTWAEGLFLLGAFIVLFSTLFSALAAWTRIFADATGKLGWIDFRDNAARRRMIIWLAWFFPITWATVSVLYGEPVKMVLLGGIATSALLVLVVVAALVFRTQEHIEEVRPGRFYDAALALSAASIVALAGYGLWRAAADYLS